MSTLISQQDINDYEQMEEEWLEDLGAFDQFWERKRQDESLLFDWFRDRNERTVENFARLAKLPGTFHTKVMDITEEAFLVGMFFGELRWNKDINRMMEFALEPATGEG